MLVFNGAAWFVLGGIDFRRLPMLHELFYMAAAVPALLLKSPSVHHQR